MSNSTVIISTSESSGFDTSALTITLIVMVFYLSIALTWMTKGNCCCCCCSRKTRVTPVQSPRRTPRTFLVEEPKEIVVPKTAWVYVTTPRGGHVMLGRAAASV